MRKKIKFYSALILMGGFVVQAQDVMASSSFSEQFNVGCEACHTSSNGLSNNVKQAARSALRANGVVPGLQDYVAGLSSGGNNGNGGGSNKPPINTRPIISPVSLEWDVEAGQTITIPLSVTDDQQDAYQIQLTGKSKPYGVEFSDEYTADNGLSTQDLTWTPEDEQANKVYTLKLVAKETETVKKKTSLPVTVKIRVWPADGAESAYVDKILISKTKWKNEKLELKGKIVLNKILTKAERDEFFSRDDLTLRLTQGKPVDGEATGEVIDDAFVLVTDNKGNWSASDINLPSDPVFYCDVTAELAGKLATRKINGAIRECLK